MVAVGRFAVTDVWSFLGDASNRAVLTWVGGGLVILAGGAWTVFKYFVKPSRGGTEQASGGGVLADRGGIAGGRDVTITTSHGLSGAQVVLLVLAVAGAIVLAAGLFGDRITAIRGVAAGGDVKGSTISIDGGETGAADP